MTETTIKADFSVGESFTKNSSNAASTSKNKLNTSNDISFESTTNLSVDNLTTESFITGAATVSNNEPNTQAVINFKTTDKTDLSLDKIMTTNAATVAHNKSDIQNVLVFRGTLPHQENFIQENQENQATTKYKSPPITINLNVKTSIADDFLENNTTILAAGTTKNTFTSSLEISESASDATSAMIQSTHKHADFFIH